MDKQDDDTSHSPMKNQSELMDALATEDEWTVNQKANGTFSTFKLDISASQCQHQCYQPQRRLQVIEGKL